MKNLSIRNKILLIAALPAILLTLTLSTMSHFNMLSLADANAKLIEEYSLDASKQRIQDIVEVATTAIKPIYEQAGSSDEEAKKQALDILRSMDFGKGNYVFVYQYDGTNLATRPRPDLEGKNLIGLKDVNNKLLIKDLIDIAKKGSGYYEYVWQNPATKFDEPKISYATGLSKWQWMVGAGIYLDARQAQIDGVLASSQEQVANNIAVKIGVSILGLIALVLLTFWGSNSISRPIKSISDILKKVSEGDLTCRVNNTNQDEVGRAGQFLNQFLERTSDVLGKVSESAHTLSSSASHVNQTTSETYDAINQQDEETTSIAAAIEEMSVSAQEIALNGESVKDSANDANQKTSQGAESVKVNLESMKLLASDIDVAADAVTAVEKRTSEIQSMLEVIHSVTEQTNLLALNAAIEAARAGEQGRGFAVVADEVRALARRSGESAEEIRRIIEGLITDTQSAVGTMMSSKERSESNLEQTQTMADSLVSIDTAISDILEKSAQIAQGTNEQNVVAQDIAQNTSRIKDIAKESADKMHGTKESSHQLNLLSKDLIQSIAYFRYK